MKRHTTTTMVLAFLALASSVSGKNGASAQGKKVPLSHHHRYRHDPNADIYAGIGEQREQSRQRVYTTPALLKFLQRGGDDNTVAQTATTTLSTVLHRILLDKREGFPLAAPLWIYIANLVLIGTPMTLMRQPGLGAKMVECIATTIPGGYIAEARPAFYHAPLSFANWIVHFVLNTFSIEIPYRLFLRLQYHSARASSSPPAAKKKTFALFVLFALACIQSWATQLSHSAINVNGPINVGFLVWEFVLMRTQVFGMGLSLLFGWKAIVPVLFLVMMDIAKFDNVVGICMSSLSSIVLLMQSNEIVPLGFKLAWLSMTTLPITVKDSTTDWGHMTGAMIISIPILVMLMSLNMTERGGQHPIL